MSFNISKEGCIGIDEEVSSDSSSAGLSALGSGGGDELSKIDALAKQLGQIAKQMDALADEKRPATQEPPITPSGGETLPEPISNPRTSDNAGPAPLDAGRIRTIIRHRQMRARFFKGALFSDPAWDMLLDLTAAQIEQAQVSVTSLCIASGVADTTALRWINVLVEEGLFKRVNDETDKRRVFIELTPKATRAVSGYFEALDQD